MGEERPAGGVLLEEVLDSFTNGFIESLTRQSNKDAGVDMKKLREKARKRVLEAVAGCVREGGRCWRAYLANSLKLADAMLGDLVEGLRAGGSEFCSILDLSFALSSPGLTGVGSGLFSGVFEVGLTMDWLLGLPFYPGSTLKGAVRSTARDMLVGRGLSPEEAEDILAAVFGRAGEDGVVGSVVFFDSYPIGCRMGSPCLVLTGGVVTPHYYRGGEPVEAEYDAQPNPVQHVVIAPGTVFRVVAGVKKPTIRDEKDAKNIELESFISAILGDNASNASSGLQGGYYCVNLAYAIGLLVVASFERGFAARSGKGYNILRPYTGEVHRNIESLRVYLTLKQVKHQVKSTPKGPKGGFQPSRGTGSPGSRGTRGGRHSHYHRPGLRRW